MKVGGEQLRNIHKLKNNHWKIARWWHLFIDIVCASYFSSNFSSLHTHTPRSARKRWLNLWCQRSWKFGDYVRTIYVYIHSFMDNNAFLCFSFVDMFLTACRIPVDYFLLIFNTVFSVQSKTLENVVNKKPHCANDYFVNFMLNAHAHWAVVTKTAAVHFLLVDILTKECTINFIRNQFGVQSKCPLRLFCVFLCTFTFLYFRKQRIRCSSAVYLFISFWIVFISLMSLMNIEFSIRCHANERLLLLLFLLRIRILILWMTIVLVWTKIRPLCDCGDTV